MNATPKPWTTGGTFMPDSDDPRENIWGPTPAGCQSGTLVAMNLKPADAREIVKAVNSLAGKNVFEDLLREWLFEFGSTNSLSDRTRSALLSHSEVLPLTSEKVKS